jgi:hypothetical protein
MGNIGVALRSPEKAQKALKRSDLPPTGHRAPRFFQDFYGTGEAFGLVGQSVTAKGKREFFILINY